MVKTTRWRWGVLLMIGAALFAFAGSNAAQDKKQPYEKHDGSALYYSLRDVINTGAKMFNDQGDHAGCYRLYQGSLISVRPFLAPDLQKKIDAGLASAEKLSTFSDRAFELRKVIDEVRDKTRPTKTGDKKSDDKKADDKKDVKKDDAKDKKKETKKDDTKKDDAKDAKKDGAKKDTTKDTKKDAKKDDAKDAKKDDSKKDTTKDAKKDTKKDDAKDAKKDDAKKDTTKDAKKGDAKDKKKDAKKDDAKKDTAKDAKKDNGKDKKIDDKKSASASGDNGQVAGKLQFQGQAVQGGYFVTLIAKGGKKFSSAIQKDGSFQFKTPIPTGDYRIAIEAIPGEAAKGPGLPPRYAAEATSGLSIRVQAGKQAVDLNLVK
jgi:hypothetical protein